MLVFFQLTFIKHSWFIPGFSLSFLWLSLSCPPSLSLIFFLVTQVLAAQSCPTLWDPMDCGPQGSSVHRILQARILEWVAISFSRGSSRPRNQTRVSCIAGRFFSIWATREESNLPETCSTKGHNDLLPHCQFQSTLKSLFYLSSWPNSTLITPPI